MIKNQRNRKIEQKSENSKMAFFQHKSLTCSDSVNSMSQSNAKAQQKKEERVLQPNFEQLRKPPDCSHTPCL
jgi:hypothetical protein